MGRKSRYTEYAKGMNKGTAAKNATTTKSKSIKNKLQELKKKSKKEMNQLNSLIKQRKTL